MKKSLAFLKRVFLLGLFTANFFGLNQNAFAGLDRIEIKNIIIKESKKTKFVTPSLALAVAESESSFRPDVVSHAGAIGVMQIMPATANGLYGIKKSQLYNPHTNIIIGVQFLEHLIKKYDGRIDLALSHYNGGSKVRRNGKYSIIPQTRSYVEKVLHTARKYKVKLSKGYRSYNKNGNSKFIIQNEGNSGRTYSLRLKDVDRWLAISKSL